MLSSFTYWVLNTTLLAPSNPYGDFFQQALKGIPLESASQSSLKQYHIHENEQRNQNFLEQKKKDARVNSTQPLSTSEAKELMQSTISFVLEQAKTDTEVEKRELLPQKNFLEKKATKPSEISIPNTFPSEIFFPVKK